MKSALRTPKKKPKMDVVVDLVKYEEELFLCQSYEEKNSDDTQVQVFGYLGETLEEEVEEEPRGTIKKADKIRWSRKSHNELIDGEKVAEVYDIDGSYDFDHPMFADSETNIRELEAILEEAYNPQRGYRV